MAVTYSIFTKMSHLLSPLMSLTLLHSFSGIVARIGIFMWISGVIQTVTAAHPIRSVNQD